MGHALFIVVLSRESWWVDFEGAAIGPFVSRELAALEARNRASAISRLGRTAEVVVPDAEGQLWVIWSSAHTDGDGPFVPHRAGRSWRDSRKQ